MVDPAWIELVLVVSSTILAGWNSDVPGPNLADISEKAKSLRSAALMFLAICMLIGNTLACNWIGCLLMFMSAVALSVVVRTYDWGRPIVSVGAVYILTRPMTTCHTLSSAPALRLITANSGLCLVAVFAPRLLIHFADNHLAIRQEPAVDVADV